VLGGRWGRKGAVIGSDRLSHPRMRAPPPLLRLKDGRSHPIPSARALARPMRFDTVMILRLASAPWSLPPPRAFLWRDHAMYGRQGSGRCLGYDNDVQKRTLNNRLGSADRSSQSQYKRMRAHVLT
jgi:hypothetical protein